MDYMVLYASVTGNTKKVATEIFSALPGMSKDMQNVLSELHNKKIALFGTCGMGRGTEYYRDIEQKAKVWIPDDCEYLGMFLCQGKMPMKVREKYEISREDPREEAFRKQMLKNFDEALFHPNSQDLEDARAFAESLTAQKDN